MFLADDMMEGMSQPGLCEAAALHPHFHFHYQQEQQPPVLLLAQVGISVTEPAQNQIKKKLKMCSVSNLYCLPTAR